MDASVGVPIHVQLEEQLKHLILSGYFEEGGEFPSNRELAGYLRVNRNTVARVMSRLERQGYAESRRGLGRRVKRPPVNVREAERERLVEEVLWSAAARGFSAEEVGRALLARAGGPALEKIPIVFVECNPWQVQKFSAELEERLPVQAKGLLISELRDAIGRGEEVSSSWVVTTFFHVREVESLTEGTGVETVGLLSVATLDNLQRLQDLDPGTTVAVLGDVREGVYNLVRSIKGAGLDHLDLVALWENGDEMREVFGRAQAVVCSSRVARDLAQLGAPADLPVIVEDRTLDQGGIDMLGRLLKQSKPEGRSSL
ncbi:GntR family transcriptional regulator [Rubrobacter tropicus]|uniref:GntR family transcriptional regulator n=1 Tax=Rubrobacter tropicus TaxID=2653851 RepID=UPI00140E2EC4|nr:GntR family transcriptional regulator [Rubrobacter tropicus]